MNDIIRYGVDMAGRFLQLAGCNCSTGRVVINRLSRTDLDESEPEMIDSSGRLQFSIPEEMAIIKRVKVPPDKNRDGKELAEFEFLSTLLDKKEELYVDITAVNGGTDYLVYGFHRHLIDEKKKFYEKMLIKPSGYKLRASALADGYHHFCWREGGELICLLDLSLSGGSFCFVNNSRPICVGCIANNDDSPDGQNEIPESLLSDLKATIQYHTAGLFKAGYTAPLSLVVVSGITAGNEINNAIEEKLGIRTISPTIKTSLFAPEIVDRAGHFLVSLGLTVNDR
ncbi:MAG TPA: hypothetical protein ENL22_02205 [candidate division Zixibacteria bacterium]|nr:hypothetical protein [candidate division Zixibacteria bacterium]